MTHWDPNTNGFYLAVNWVRFIESKKWVWFIESEKFNSNRENIKVYEVNLDIFSIANDFFAFNEPASEHRQNHSNIWVQACSLKSQLRSLLRRNLKCIKSNNASITISLAYKPVLIQLHFVKIWDRNYFCSHFNVQWVLDIKISSVTLKNIVITKLSL